MLENDETIHENANEDNICFCFVYKVKMEMEMEIQEYLNKSVWILIFVRNSDIGIWSILNLYSLDIAHKCDVLSASII